MGYYVIKFLSEAYTLQEDTTYNVQISTSSELVVKAQYIPSMQYKTKWYWEYYNNRTISLFKHAQLYINV